MRNKVISFELNEQTFTKLVEFAVPRGIHKTDIIKALIERSDIKIDVQQYKPIKHNTKIKKRHSVQVSMPDEILTKINNMSLQNNITNSEIVNQLVTQADLNSMSFRGKKHELLYFMLNEQTFNKIGEFAVPRGIVKTDIIKALIEKLDIKIDLQQYDPIKRNKQGRRKKYRVGVLMSEELQTKIKNIRLHKHTTNSEIVNQLIMQADLNSMHFKVKREKQGNKNIIGINLDATRNRKIQEFALVHGYYVSEVIRAMVKKSSVKIKDIRNRGEVIDHSKQKGKIDLTRIVLMLPKPLLLKLRKMSLHNKASCSEIVRVLIDRTDLDSLKIKTKIRTGKTLKIAIKLDNFTNKKIREFSAMNNVSISEIGRVLIDNSDLKINARRFSSIAAYVKKHGRVSIHSTVMWLTKELLDKIKEARAHYETSHSEILRILIREADLNSMTFRTRKRMKYGRKNRRNRY